MLSEKKERVIMGIDPGTSIMGYGIIAVPTGIVTAELSKNRKSKNVKNNCPRCKTFIYNEYANYCYNCGEKFIDGEVKIDE